MANESKTRRRRRNERTKNGRPRWPPVPKKRAHLEIDLRIEDLKKALYSFAFDVTLVWHTIYSIRRDTKATIAASSLSESEFRHLAVHKIISDLSEQRANVFGFKIPVAAQRQPTHTAHRQPSIPSGSRPQDSLRRRTQMSDPSPSTYSHNNPDPLPLRLSTSETTVPTSWPKTTCPLLDPIPPSTKQPPKCPAATAQSCKNSSRTWTTC